MDKLQKFCVISLTQGGRHADNTVDLQEFMIMPTGAENMEQAIRMCAEVYQFLRIILKQKGLSTAVGDEGGFAPDLSDSESVLEVILEAVKRQGMNPERISALQLMLRQVNCTMKKEAFMFPRRRKNERGRSSQGFRRDDRIL